MGSDGRRERGSASSFSITSKIISVTIFILIMKAEEEKNNTHPFPQL